MNRLLRTYLIAACLLLLGSTISLAQEAKALVSMDRDQIMIGEHVKLTLTLTLPVEAENLVWPAIKDTLSANIEVLEQSVYDTTVLGNPAAPTAVLHQQELLITSYDSGYFVVPPFQFSYNDTTIETEVLLLTAQVLPVDTAQAPRDIKDIIELPETWEEWFAQNWPWVAGGAALLLLVWILIVKLRKRKNVGEPVAPPKPTEPPHVTALAALKALDKQKLWQQGKVKDYHIELAFVLWKYLEARFQVVAVEQTTDEILQNLRFAEINEKNRAALAQILKLGDLVKFAREKPLPSENERCMMLAIEFVTDNVAVSKPTEIELPPKDDHSRFKP